MRTCIIKESMLLQELSKASITQCNIASQLTAIDIYVGEDHLRIATHVDKIDRVMTDIIRLIRIPGESTICHEVINVDDTLVDYSKYPIVTNWRQLSYHLIQDLGLVWMWECKGPKHYMKTTCVPMAAEFAQMMNKYGGTVEQYLTRL